MGKDMVEKSSVVTFVAPYQVAVEQIDMSPPGEGEVLIETRLSAISSGTELLAYRGQLPADISLDESITGMDKEVAYPFQYGYAAVGVIKEVGAGVDLDWANKNVFGFYPHASCFLARPQMLTVLPANLATKDAVFLANMETAVSFLMDGRPMIGEKVLVVGLGVVGLLTTALLIQQANLEVHCVDPLKSRRERAEALGATAWDPEELIDVGPAEAFDLVYELSGNPAGLNSAIGKTRKTGRIILGSWYGSKPANVNLGGRFHRSKINIYASQVSTIAPELSGRWTKERRLQLALSYLNKIQPSQFVSHTFDVSEVPRAYALLDSGQDDVLQVVISYD